MGFSRFPATGKQVVLSIHSSGLGYQHGSPLVPSLPRLWPLWIGFMAVGSIVILPGLTSWPAACFPQPPAVLLAGLGLPTSGCRPLSSGLGLPVRPLPRARPLSYYQGVYSGPPAWFLSVSTAPPSRSPGDRRSPADSFELGFPGCPSRCPRSFSAAPRSSLWACGALCPLSWLLSPSGQGCVSFGGHLRFLLVLPWNSFRTFSGFSSWRPWSPPAGLPRRCLPCGHGSAARGPVLSLQGMLVSPHPSSW